MQRDKIWDYEVQLDKAATAGWYEKSGGWGCECRHCQNFLALSGKNSFRSQCWICYLILTFFQKSQPI